MKEHLKRIVENNINETSTDQAPTDLVVFSHLRWDFVYQRPQHLISRHAKQRRTFFVEEPIYTDGAPRLVISEREDQLKVVVPHLPHGLEPNRTREELRFLVDQLMTQENILRYTAWYYTPMALPFTDHLAPQVVIYDCMDELSAFRGAPPELIQLEKRLLEVADLVFTGGYSIFEAKKNRHRNIHPFPSSIDYDHFARARKGGVSEPADQASIPGPRLGFFGVIDERFDVKLIAEVARLRPDWQLVLIGPVVKISQEELPKAPNIHYLGMKHYRELPDYLAGWQVAMLPFAKNESTKFISPTKTPEYLAAGRPVVSTSIRDVVRPYGDEGLVSIADTAEEFVDAIATLLQQTEANDQDRLKTVDQFLALQSWDKTHARMCELEEELVGEGREVHAIRTKSTPRTSTAIESVLQ